MAATVPLSHGTADLSMAVARKADRDYQRQMEANEESQNLINDEGRRRAIRAAMEAGGHAEETILDALAALGLREGGIVSLRDGGRIGFTKGGDVMKAIERGIDPSQALDLLQEFKKIKEEFGYEMSFSDWLDGEVFATGGRVGLKKGGDYDSRATPGEFRKALENVSSQSRTKQDKDLQQFTQNFLADNAKLQGNLGGLGGLHLRDRGGYILTGGPDAKPNFSNIYAGYLGKGLNKDQIRGQAIADTFSLSGPYSDPMLTPGTASPYSWESMVQNKAQSDYIAKLLGAKDGGRIGLLRGGDPDDYSQQQDVGTFRITTRRRSSDRTYGSRR